MPPLCRLGSLSAPYQADRTEPTPKHCLQRLPQHAQMCDKTTARVAAAAAVAARAAAAAALVLPLLLKVLTWLVFGYTGGMRAMVQSGLP